MPQDALNPKVVDGTTYLFSYLPPRQALALWSRLAKHLVPALASAFPKKGKLLEVELSELDWTGAAGHVSEMLAGDDFAKDVDLLLTTVRTQDGAPVELAMFPGRLAHVLKLAMQALEVNYSDFFAVFKSVAAAAKAAQPQTEKAPA